MPVLVLLARDFLQGKILAKVNEGVRDAVNEAVMKVLVFLFGLTFSAVFNAVAFLVVVFWVSNWCSKSVGVFLICSIYASSVLSVFIKIILNVDVLLRIIFAYKLNVFSYLEDEIRSEVYAEVRSQLKRQPRYKVIFLRLSGKTPDVLAEMVSERAIPIFFEVMTRIFIYFAFAAIFYVVCFRMVVVPYLLFEKTGFGFFDSFLWPFAYSVDYFLGTTFAKLIAPNVHV